MAIPSDKGPSAHVIAEPARRRGQCANETDGLAGEEVPLAIEALPLQFIPKEVLNPIRNLCFMGDLREGVGCRVAVSGQNLGSDENAGTGIDRGTGQHHCRMIFRRAISGGQIGLVISRQTESRSQEALASGGPIYADQYVTNCH